MATTRVYIDGFNLYHGIVRANALHWLDLSAFATRLNRGLPVDRVIYCTAMVSDMPSDPQKSQRQDAYHRALRIACRNVEIVKGQFTSHKKHQVVAGCKESPACVTKVVVRNEKGSDVNIASRLLHDAHMGFFDRAIVVSGDSDLVEPIRLVTEKVKREVWVRNPRDVSSQELSAVATNYAKINRSVLVGSQLPNSVSDANSTYTKPAKWDQPSAKPSKNEVTLVVCTQANCSNEIKTCRYL